MPPYKVVLSLYRVTKKFLEVFIFFSTGFSINTGLEEIYISSVP